MCGIIGFSGYEDATSVLTNGLAELEYRGYDSAGIAISTFEGINTIKTIGKVADLKEKLSNTKISKSNCGIGHTRWATHGGVTDINAHPHTVGNVTLIHNGIIENYNEVLIELSKNGKQPISETDTEIATMLIDSLYDGDAYTTIHKAVDILEGAFAFCIIFKDQPETVYAVRNSSPLVATHTERGSFIASDVTALIKYSKDYFVIPEYHIVALKKDSITLTTPDNKVIEPKMLHVNWDTTAAQKGGYPHFMLKEINEQPNAIHSTIAPRIKNGFPDFSADNIPDKLFDGISNINITACGTAMHAGLVAKNLIEKMLRIPVTVDVASEFRYQEPLIDNSSLVIVISQSGETADTLAALRLAKSMGSKTLAIVNVKGSSIAQESDYVLYTHAGPEIAVASTKAFTVQLAALYLIAIKIGEVTGKLSEKYINKYINHLQNTIDIVSDVLKLEPEIKEISNFLTPATDLFYLGRGLDYSLACEGSLKLKEISYIHSEAYMAGELKHGTISLIEENTPVIAIATQKNVFTKMISNIREVNARGAKVILITTGKPNVDANICEKMICLPEIDDKFASFPVTIVLQLLAYHTSVNRGLNVDKPRNLAKSVTVE